MTAARLLAGFRSSLQRRGLLGTARRGLNLAFHSLVPRRERPHPFDLRSGLDTGGLLRAEKITSGHAHDGQTTAYYGSQPSVFLGMMERWREVLRDAGEALEDFTFVDIGCGKGRVLMLASEFPFRAIVGVELSPELARAADENLRRWALAPRACAEIQVLERDVLEYPLPDGPALLFLYHPFEGELFATWVQTRLSTAARRTMPLYLAYLNPVHEGLLAAAPRTQLLWAGDIAFSAEEEAVHLFGGASERISLYRLTAPGLLEGPGRESRLSHRSATRYHL